MSASIHLLRRMVQGAAGPLIGAVALFVLPLLGAVLLPTPQFAFWSILSSVSTISLSLDFGGVSLLTARFFSEKRSRLLVKCASLSVAGSILIGVAAAAIWALNSNTLLDGSVDRLSAVLAILVMTLASAVRSLLMVYAQAGLVMSALFLRNLCTAGHAFLASAVTIGLLFFYHSFWALPLGWLVSGIVVLPFAMVLYHRQERLYPASLRVSQKFSWSLYAVWRTISALLSSVVQQGDRWVIAALAGPSVLAVYEVCWRFATLPRFLVQNLVARVGADTSAFAVDDTERLRQLTRNAVRATAPVGIALSAVMVVCYWIFTSVTHVDANFLLVISMTAVFTLYGFTYILSSTGAALGSGFIDIPYLLVAVVLSAGFAAASYILENPSVFIFGYLATLTFGTLLFFAYAPRVVSRTIKTRVHA